MTTIEVIVVMVMVMVMVIVLLAQLAAAAAAGGGGLSLRCFEEEEVFVFFDASLPLPPHRREEDCDCIVDSSLLALLNTSTPPPAPPYWDLTMNCLHSVDVTLHREGLAVNFSLWRQAIDPCHSFANMVMLFYEAVAFGLKHGVMVARVDYPASTSTATATTTCPTLHLIHSLPLLVVPKSTHRMSSEEVVKHCHAIHRFPWEHSDALFWQQWVFFNGMTRDMVQTFAFRHQQQLPLIPLLRQEEEEVSDQQVHPLSTIAIHFRCSDNIFHHHMGLQPLLFYRQSIDNIIRQEEGSSSSGSSVYRVVIVTDATLHGVGGEICWQLLGELEHSLNTWNKEKERVSKKREGAVSALLEVEVVKEGAAWAFYRLHGAVDHLVCTASTFCLLASLGGTAWTTILSRSPLLKPPLPLPEESLDYEVLDGGKRKRRSWQFMESSSLVLKRDEAESHTAMQKIIEQLLHNLTVEVNPSHH
eukprot:scaffold2263_cov187-Ochromonas_danica.AAC.2